MNKLMSRTGSAVLGGALTVGALLGATPAQAAYLSDVHVEVSWRGSNCLSFYGPIRLQFSVGSRTLCSSSRLLVWDSTAERGELIGVDPVMDGNSVIMCTLFVIGRYGLSDYVNAGDGHEASCLVRL